METDRPFSLRWQRQAAPSISLDKRTITPHAASLTVRWPLGGFVWNTPVGVTVEEDGRRTEIPVTDYTRLVLLALAAVTLLVTLAVRMGRRT